MAAPTSSSGVDVERPWGDPRLPLDERVETLLAAMTLPEKLAQLGSVWLGFGGDNTGDVAPMEDLFRAGSREFPEAIEHGLGQLTRVFGTKPITAEQGRTK